MFERSRRHLIEAGETYWQHMRFAGTVGLMAIGAGLACLIHALIPALCQHTCSRTVGLMQQLFHDRRALPAIAAEASGIIVFVALLGLSLVSGSMPTIAGAPSALGMGVSALTLAVPLTYLLSNTELDPIEQE